jgi:CP family cyanate transporter-like MFS transporter
VPEPGGGRDGAGAGSLGARSIREPDGRLLLLATLVAAFNLRLGIVAPGPLIETIRADIGMSSAVAGLLVTIPLGCMSLFAFAGPLVVRRHSSYDAVLLGLLLVAAGTLARAVAPSPALLAAATIPIGVGIAVAGVALPVIVKQRFERRSGAATGAYVSAQSIGVVVIAVAIGPLADAVGGWRPAFALSAIPTVVAIAFWVVVTRRIEPAGSRAAVVGPRAAGAAGPRAAGVAPPPAAGVAPRRAAGAAPPPAAAAAPRRALPDRVEVLLALSFGLQSMCYAGLVGWVAAVYVDVGWSEGAAALATASLGLFQIPGSLIFPSLSQGRDRRPWLAATVAVMALGVIGVGLAPGGAAPLWLLAFGIGVGAVFALQLALPIDLRASPQGVARLTAWMLGLGYAVAALSPTLVGAIRDATGGFAVPMTGLGLLALLGIVVAFMLPPPLASRAGPPVASKVAR